LAADAGIVSERGILNEQPLGFTARSNLDVVGLAFDVGRDGDVVPNPRIVRIRDVAVVDSAVSGIDESVSGKADDDRCVRERVDFLGTDCHESV
jgi:hypothetical protein